MDIKSNCPLCFKHELHVIEKNGSKLMQCLSCGYATTDKFKIDNESDLEENHEYKKLTEDMKGWSKVKNNRIWIPGIMTLPNGMLYPINIDNMVNHKVEMKWGLAELVDVPKEEQKDYPNPNGGFFEKKYDDSNAQIFEEFSSCMKELEKLSKEWKKKLDDEKASVESIMREREDAKKLTKLTLPKLKKIKDGKKNN